jgi:hypothetical protein
MGRVCSEIFEWVEEEILRPIEEWEDRQERRCRRKRCNWWTLCLNKIFCWLVWVAVKVTRWILEIVGAWIPRIICYAVNIVLDAVGFIFNLFLSIPIIGGVYRAILNWGTELIWRVFGIFDFLASWAGILLRKKMYFGIVVPSVGGAPIASDGDIMNQVNAAIQFYDQTCNINMIFTGICHTAVPAPSAGLTVNCSASGFLNDFWLAGSYFEFATATCQYLDGFRRVIGYGSEIVVFIVQNVTPDTPNNAIGCSFASTHNYVVVEADSTVSNFAASHEIGHACLLPHSSGTNLMNTSVPFTNPTLTALQIAVVRWSKHCVYF